MSISSSVFSRNSEVFANQWELQKYHLSMGSRGESVRVVKELLNINLRSSYQTDKTDVFDSKLQMAVAEFQRIKRLSNTEGTVNAVNRTISRQLSFRDDSRLAVAAKYQKC